VTQFVQEQISQIIAKRTQHRRWVFKGFLYSSCSLDFSITKLETLGSMGALNFCKLTFLTCFHDNTINQIDAKIISLIELF